MDTAPAGRAAEVAEICAFLSPAAATPSAIVISGDMGIGKTAVWKHVARTVRRGCLVLSCRPAPAEQPLAFSALDDLLGGVAEAVLPMLTDARRRALEAALQRGGPRPPGARGRPPDRRVLASGVLDVLRILSADRRLVLAVDDVRWLDRRSAGLLEFCIRRLECEDISILVTLAAEEPVLPLGLDLALPPARLARVRLGPLSAPALSEILTSRFNVTFPRHILARLHEASGGNPFYALEFARAALERGRAVPAGEPIPIPIPIPIPKRIRDLVRPRLRGLSREALRVGRLLAAATDPREAAIRAAYGEDSWLPIDQAIDDGIIERDGDALRFTHPLLRPVLYAGMTMSERRDVHRRLAAAAPETGEQAWHLALSAEGPSDRVAAMTEAAAGQAASRGATETAAAFAEQAVRLTPAGQQHARSRRMVLAADYHFRCGDVDRSRELVESVLAGCPAGSRRASLLIRLAAIRARQGGWTLAEGMLRQALAEATEDLALRARAEQELASARLMAGDLTAACCWAGASLRSAAAARDAARPGLVAHSRARLMACEFLQGNPIQEDLTGMAGWPGSGEERFTDLALFGPALVRGTILKWSDRLDEARRAFADCHRRVLDHGDRVALPFLLSHFSELECWAGNWPAAEEYALEGCRVASESNQQAVRPAPLYSLALVRAHRGQVEDAQALATEALVLCERTGNASLSVGALTVLGFIALSLDDHQTAHAHLGRLAESSGRNLGEPSMAKFLPDAIEALSALGEVSLARRHTQRLQSRGASLGRAWALAAAARSRAHLAGVTGDLEAALAACAEALSAHERLPMPFELGRTLLVKGRIERRARQKSAAAGSLRQALAIFERLGAPLWAAKARQELSKIAARALTVGLTETQRRVAALVAEGRTNREIAAAMFITENTVQTHVRHIFQKLGLRSRTELAVRLLAAQPPA